MTGGLLSPLSLDASVVILAGGQSSRLRTAPERGSSKAFLPVEGQPLIARTVHRLAALSRDLIVVTNDPAPYGPLALPARLVPDEKPGQGSLMGIYSGLTAALYPRALVVACDMPFLNLPLLRYMLSLAGGSDVVIPQVGGLFEPLHAVYGKTCLLAMARLLNQGGRQIIAFFHEVRVRCVEEQEIDRFDPLHLSFVNINTPADWDEAQELLAKKHNGPASAGKDQTPDALKS
jgi:molybdopterin-guanine dinucleotide biosynthesis protein A